MPGTNQQTKLAPRIKRVILSIERHDMRIAINSRRLRVPIAFAVGRLPHKQIRVAQIAPLTTQIIRHLVVEIMRKTRHSTVRIVRRDAKHVKPVAGRAVFSVVRVHQIALVVVAASTSASARCWFYVENAVDGAFVKRAVVEVVRAPVHVAFGVGRPAAYVGHGEVNRARTALQVVHPEAVPALILVPPSALVLHPVAASAVA